MPTPINEQLKTLPAKPGVYLFKDNQGKVIYVGKAASLRHRLRAYFSPSTNLSPKLQRLVARIADFESIVTDSEQEALILECNLIKKFRPSYNVRLKDDKTFPYLKIDLKNDWPSVRITRRFHKNGDRYFGPYASAGSLRQTLRLIKKIFPFRSCTRNITGKEIKPCLEYHIHRCLGPCTGAVSKEEYHEVIRQVILFLEGKQEVVLRDLRQKMKQASEHLQFEKAALLRDQIRAIEKVIEGQKIAVTVRGDQDAIALAQTKDLAYVEIFFIRSNKLIGRDYILLDGIHDETPQQIMTSFVKQYYTTASSIPPLLLLQHPVDEPAVITRWLTSQRGAPVKLHVPRQGAKKQLIDIVAENAHQGLALYQAKQSTIIQSALALEELKERLALPSVPLRIEAYDISNIRGNLATGSMAVLDKGTPKPSHYRRFKIKTVAGIDDYAMIQEVLRRRFHRHLADEEKWAPVPDLILIDGGKGHLNAALEIMKELGLDSIPTASIAKEKEEVFLPGRPEPLDIPPTSAALHLLQRIRDEAHRFALGYHQRLRHKEGITSALDIIPGIGPKRKKALLKRFGSVPAIREASLEELAATEGMTMKLAEKVKEYL
ncbi:MAG TPA: excinuclease ABC subunit UvrC [Dehalococcoidia bacterium]|nr:excinuclease ABC subunit UvrC [Dehalococcoidia bacterium]